MTRGARVALAVVAVGVATAVVARRAAPPREYRAPRADSAAGALPPPPLGAPGAAAAPAAAPRVLRVDSTGCTPVEEKGYAATLTLDSVARAGGIPLDVLIRGLHLPADVQRTQPLQELMREHGFTLRDVSRVVEDYLKHCE